MAVAAKCILAGVLVLLIVLGVGADVWDWFGRPHPVIDPMIHFRCLQCGHEYTKDLVDFVFPKEQTFTLAEGPMLDDCPRCGAKLAAIQLAKCPECKKYYLPKVYTETVDSGLPGNICEHCGTDVNKWYMEDAKKRKSPSRTAPKTEAPDFP